MKGFLVTTTINTLLWQSLWLRWVSSSEDELHDMLINLLWLSWCNARYYRWTLSGTGRHCDATTGPYFLLSVRLEARWCSSYRGSLGHAALSAGHPWCFLSCWLGVVLHLPVSFKQSVPFHGHFVRAECLWKALCGLPPKLPFYASVTFLSHSLEVCCLQPQCAAASLWSNTKSEVMARSGIQRSPGSSSKHVKGTFQPKWFQTDPWSRETLEITKVITVAHYIL